MASSEESLLANIEEFCILTGVDVDMARLMLEACGNDVHTAINLHLEEDGVTGVRPNFSPSAETVRAPIPPREERLVDGIQELQSRSAKRGAPGSNGWVNPFRNFQVETDRQEALLTGQGPSGASPKVRRLEDLFRPPLSMMFAGTFHAARDAGVRRNKWLMVNIQKQTEFPCQVMNRDIWSNVAIESIVKAHFVFLQVDTDSSDGRHYCQFYTVTSFPYVSVIDPRTGELLKYWTNFDAPYFAETLLAFLANNATPNPEEESPVKGSGDGAKGLTAALPSEVLTAGQRRPSQDYENEDYYFDYGNLTEDEEEDGGDDDADAANDSGIDKESGSGVSSIGGSGAAASSGAIASVPVVGVETPTSLGADIGVVAAPADGGGGRPSNLGERDVGTATGRATTVSGITTLFGESRMDTPPPEEPVPSVTLSLKFPGNHHEVVTFPATDKVSTLQNYLMESGYCMTEYEYVTFFPKRTLSTRQARVATLASLGIVRNETIFIQLRDSEDEKND